MQMRWGDQGAEVRTIPDDLLMAAVQKSMLAIDAMAARLDTLTEELAALPTNWLWTRRARCLPPRRELPISGLCGALPPANGGLLVTSNRASQPGLQAAGGPTSASPRH
jgi:hypothetical protein